MFKHTTVLYLVICALVVIIFTQRCAINKDVYCDSKIVTNTLIDSLPVKVNVDTITRKKLKEDIKKIVLQKELDNLEKIKEFENKPKELKKEVYKKAIEVNTYSNKVEDDEVKIEYTAVTSGTLDYINFDYTIKEKKFVKEKPKNHLYIGGSINANVNSDKYALNATLGLQNKKGDILHVSYGTDKSITVGYMVRLF